ncbi:MAG: hypothetical protein ACOC46_03805, partial [Pirellulales bacterium]
MKHPCRLWCALFAVAIFSFCSPACARDDAAAAAGLVGYSEPRAAVRGGELYLFARVSGVGEDLCRCFRRTDDGEWEKAGEFRAAYRAVTQHGGRFYLFLERCVVELSAADGSGEAQASFVQTARVRWPYNWPVQSAVVMSDRMLAVGADSTGNAYRAEAQMAESTRDEPGSSAGVPAAASSPPAGADGPRQFLTANFEPDRPLPLPEQGRCIEVRLLDAGEQLWVFWTTRERNGSATALRAARLDGTNLVGTAKITVESRPVGFEPCAVSGDPLVFYGTLPGELNSESRLRYRTYSEGQWGAEHTIDPVENPPGEQT